MLNEQHIVRGYTEKFYARIYDEGNELITPDSIEAYLIPPNSTYTSTSTALTVINVSTGIYSTEVSIPETAELGNWKIYWKVVIDSEETGEYESFIVDPAPDLHFESAILLENQQYTLVISKSIRDTKGNTLNSDKEIYFFTELDPMYCSVQDVRLEIGPEIESIPDSTIALRIWKASILADTITYIKVPQTGIRRNYYNMAREYFVKYKACLDLLNLADHKFSGGYKKVLGDLDITRFGRKFALSPLMEDINKEYKGWKWVVENGGEMTPGSGHKPGVAVKAGSHPNRPNIGRGYIVGQGANVKTEAESLSDGSKTRAKSLKIKYITWEAELRGN